MNKHKNKNKLKSALSNRLKHIPDSEILVEAAMRRGISLSKLIVPSSPSQARVDLKRWKDACLAARNVDYPNRNPLYQVYDNIMIDLDLSSVIETRVLKVQQSKFNIVDASGKANPELTKLFQKVWFFDFLKLVMDARFEGFRLAEFFDFTDAGEIEKVTEVDKYHVVPEKGIVTKELNDDTGYDYLNGPISQYYIPVGRTNDLGMLLKVAPIVLAKKYALGTWAEYNEKIGIPFRSIHSNSVDKGRQEQLAIIMENMGSAGWGVFNEDEKLELLVNGNGDPTKCFEGLINKLDDSVAKFFHGQSSTNNSQNNKGTYGSMQILQDITEDRHEADLTYAKYLINDLLIPRMILWGYKLTGYSFDWDKSIELTIKETVDYVVALEAAGFEVDIKFIQGKGIPVVGRRQVTTPPTGKAPTGSVKKKSLNLDAFYKDCCNHSEGPEAKATPPEFENIILNLATNLYKNKQKGIVDIPLLKATAKQLTDAITIGYKTTDNKDFDTTDLEMIRSLQSNVYVFSAFKSYANQNELVSLLKDAEGKLRSFSDYKKEVLKSNEKFNGNYLRAEYNHAVVSSQMASQWQDFERNKAVLPYLEFDATMDQRTTKTCSDLDGTRLPVDDVFWNTHCLPLHWNERSVIRQVANGPSKITGTATVPKFFQNNPGKTGVMFTDGTYPFYNTSKDANTQLHATAITAMNEDKIQAINNARVEVRAWSKINIDELSGNKYKVNTGQFSHLTLRRGDVKIITGKPHVDAVEAYNSIRDVNKLFQGAEYLGSSPDIKGREAKGHAEVKDWYYYKVLINGKPSYLNIMHTTKGEYRLHSISDELGFNEKKINNKQKK